MGLYEDAAILAKTLIDPDMWWDGDFGDYGDQKYHCHFCNGSSEKIDSKNPRSIKHDLECPILVALDILT